jgi:hypothetical protein
LDFSDEGTLFVEADAACDLAGIGDLSTPEPGPARVLHPQRQEHPRAATHHGAGKQRHTRAHGDDSHTHVFVLVCICCVLF